MAAGAGVQWRRRPADGSRDAEALQTRVQAGQHSAQIEVNASVYRLTNQSPAYLRPVHVLCTLPKRQHTRYTLTDRILGYSPRLQSAGLPRGSILTSALVAHVSSCTRVEKTTRPNSVHRSTRQRTCVPAVWVAAGAGKTGASQAAVGCQMHCATQCQSALRQALRRRP